MGKKLEKRKSKGGRDQEILKKEEKVKKKEKLKILRGRK